MLRGKRQISIGSAASKGGRFFKLLAVTLFAASICVSVYLTYILTGEMYEDQTLLIKTTGKQELLQAIVEKKLETVKLVAGRMDTYLARYLENRDSDHLESIERVLKAASNATAEIKRIDLVVGKRILVTTGDGASGGQAEKLFENDSTRLRNNGFYLDNSNDLIAVLSGPISFENQIIGLVYVHFATDGFRAVVNKDAAEDFLVYFKNPDGNTVTVFPFLRDQLKALSSVEVSESSLKEVLSYTQEKPAAKTINLSDGEQAKLLALYNTQKNIGIAGFSF